ncbi:MAG: hypothetical protein JWM11_4822 [Planctomycetaceae bacterium]|nr:hypothetical protein [Planctomycetaceae bacterium]
MSPIVLADNASTESPDEVFDIPPMMSEDRFVDWTMAQEKVRAEWVNGEVIFMSPVSARHVRLFVWLLTLLDSFSRRRKLGEVFGSEFITRMQTPSGISRRLPDIMFVTRERRNLILKNHLEGPPDLAVEIVSPESINRDWIEKRAEYETGGVREYWIIDPDAKKFEAFTLSPQGKLVSIYNQPAGAFASIVLPGLQFQIEWLWDENPPDQYDILKNLGVIP